ncbi:hypothetical protein KUK79_004483 [Vibrio parahaemolyticus]|uniref:hypothetical protein n=1 Tax=Vibrio parahaemolyticus TaxID=670 RepID=UPI00084B1440|nr:hypothetical protein [Vibrio parahaemolyticus]EHR6179776.1 hypothetical protein [Vibrio parahaemolyticus]ODY33310.1 hypothetical protein BBM21_06175 [Vibrio parahaemolyticus]
MKKIIWLLIRAFIAYLLVGVLLGILILNNTYAPRFFTMNLDILGWFSALGFLASYVLFRFKKTTEIGKFLFACVLGSIVLCLYAKESYWLLNTKVRSWTLFLTVLYTIMLLYFVFPLKWLRPLLFLVPVSAGSWVVYWLGYTPINVTISVLEAKGTIADDKYSKAIAILPDVYVTCLTSSVFWLAQTLVLYAFVYWGHDPQSSYQSLTKRLRQIRNARHFRF